MPKKSRPTNGGDCTQGMSKKDRDQLFSKLKEIAKKCQIMGMKNGICDKVKKKYRDDSRHRSGDKKKSKKSPSSFISSQNK